MNIEKQLNLYKAAEQIAPREEKIAAAVRSSKSAFYENDQGRMVSYWEFLWQQSKFIPKKWWVLQLLLLAGIWALVIWKGEPGDIREELGVAAPLFVILIIPEFWKNKTSCSLEVEGAAFYSLRQVYAARLILFAFLDALLISVFFGIASVTFRVTLAELMTQFVLPMSVTACICFQTLCSRKHGDETVAVVLCVVWGAAWNLIVSNDNIYTAVAPPIWLALLAAAVFCLCRIIHRTLNACDNYWEEQQAWN